MAIEKEIIRDVKNYQPKFIGPFSFRNFICLLAGAVVCFPVYKILDSYNFIYTFIIFVVAAIYLPFVLLGYLHPYGLTFEKFVVCFIKDTILAPTNRKYETELYHLKMAEKEIQKEKNKSSSKKKSKANKKIKESRLPIEYQSIDYQIKRRKVK